MNSGSTFYEFRSPRYAFVCNRCDFKIVGSPFCQSLSTALSHLHTSNKNLSGELPRHRVIFWEY